jgi:hypothetical chaperone protein
MLSIGIDFGTTNSSVAVYDGNRVQLLDIDARAPDPRVMRSLIYFERSGEMHFGRGALDLYLEQNTGRSVRYEMRRVGEIQMTFAEIGTLIKDAFALIDVNEPGRLFQSLKRFLPVSYFKATNVYGHDYTVEELLSVLARHLIDRIEALIGTELDELTVGWPVRFSTDDNAERLARDRTREAWRLAGPQRVSFVEEPVAAIHHFAHEKELRTDANVLVFDFGGGTLDVCIGKVSRGAVEVLATNGVALGGDLLDSRLVETELTPLFGEHARYRRTGLPLPRSLFNHLNSWQSLLELNKPEPLHLIQRARVESDQPDQFRALETLVARNYGLHFFQAVERAKVQLSTGQLASVQLDAPELKLSHPVSRSVFEAAIGPQVRQARECVLAAVEQAGMSPEEITLALTTGGSSLIPAFRRMLRACLPGALLQDSEVFTSVAAGLAVSGRGG